MTKHFTFAFIILGYVLLPFVMWLIYWLFKRFKGTKEEGEGETDV